MSKFVSEDTFSSYVTEDFNWRVREISDLRKIAATAGSGYEVAIRKAGIALLYAHWEGYVKFVGEAYVKYVAVRKFKLALLVDEFLAVEIAVILRKYGVTSGDLSSRLALVADWKALEDGQFRNFREKGISTGGNLNYDRLSDICRLIRIDPKKVVSDPDYLDRNVLGVRNKIAHGESITVTADEFTLSSDFIIEAMRGFRSETEYCIINKSYMKK
ncbi:MAE_28990/MAE_18760 family HEPN-like nuclease [Mesorhizobium caraganae]|uniref:MAE_28990/MAE_18760 family HEPN-like nuclease n=1 Tax=Mesorhizobium caraganae TaxID=483206 RepID=UPI00177BD009|nr:MAE_28990/MAE_18760 family HEPN-like nuclease [Mesorhizobium caraganae]